MEANENLNNYVQKADLIAKSVTLDKLLFKELVSFEITQMKISTAAIKAKSENKTEETKNNFISKIAESEHVRLQLSRELCDSSTCYFDSCRRGQVNAFLM